MSWDLYFMRGKGDDAQPVVFNDDPDFAMRRLVPMRSSASCDGASFNLTYNLGEMLRAAGMTDAWNGLAGKTGAKVAKALAPVIAELERDPDFYRTFEPANGWGTYDDALLVCKGVAMVGELHPDARLRVA